MANPAWKSIILTGGTRGTYTQTWVLETPQGYVVKNRDWVGTVSMTFVPDAAHSWNPGEIDPLDPDTQIFDGLFLKLTQVVEGTGGTQKIRTWIPSAKVLMMQPTTSGPSATTIFLEDGQKIDVLKQVVTIRAEIGGG
jgi:hypothetical protein